MLTNLIDCLSCATGIHAVEYVPPSAQTDGEVTLDVRGFWQTDTYSCGACAGFSITATFHPEVDFGDFYEVIEPQPGSGVGTRKLCQALKQFGVGYKVRKHMTFAQFAKSIDDGYPLIVGRLTEYGEDHWAVVYGYGRNPKILFLAGRSGNPLLPTRIDWESFDHSFRAVDGPAIQCWGL